MAQPISEPLSNAALDQLFRAARSFSHWQDKPVSEEQIHAIHDLVKMAPTSANQQPGRYVWCHSPEAREKLAECAAKGNVEQIITAPLCVIIGYDLEFHEELPWLYPHTDARSWFTDDADARRESAFRNGTLQGAYLIMAARALGLDCGPMSGFDQDAVNAAFFAEEPNTRANFICSIGYGDRDKLHARSPRPDFATFNRIA